MLDLSEVDGFGHMSTYMYICVYISFFLGCGSHLNRLYIHIVLARWAWSGNLLDQGLDRLLR